jgi:hypothetical protein
MPCGPSLPLATHPPIARPLQGQREESAIFLGCPGFIEAPCEAVTAREVLLHIRKAA